MHHSANKEGPDFCTTVESPFKSYKKHALILQLDQDISNKNLIQSHNYIPKTVLLINSAVAPHVLASGRPFIYP